MSVYSKLGGQTLVYGLGNIVPRILNYAILTFYYTRRFSVEQYGIITELYAYVAILLVILTYGMETGLFKFAAGNRKLNEVFSTAFTSVFITSFLFVFVILLSYKIIADWINYGRIRNISVYWELQSQLMPLLLLYLLKFVCRKRLGNLR